MNKRLIQRQNTERRNEAIRKEYDDMNALKKYRQDWIFETIAKKYFISASTVMQVVFKKGIYNQQKNEKLEENTENE